MSRTSLFALVFITTLLPLAAQVPQLISQQGRIAVDGANFDGTGQFRFAFVNSTGSVTYWSNDGTSTAGSEPAAAVAIPVTKGHYSVDLGDPSLSNMAALPDSLFDQGDLHLRVWFDGGTGSEHLTPDRRLTATPFARLARTVQPGSINSSSIAPNAIDSSHIAAGEIRSSEIASGAVLRSHLANGAVDGTKIANDAVGSAQIAFGAIDSADIAVGAVASTHLGSGSVQSAKIANNAVNSSKIANSTIQPADLNLNTFNTTFWRTGGNAGTTNAHFLGTTDNRPLEFRANGSRRLLLDGDNVIGGSQLNSVDPGGDGSTVFGGITTAALHQPNRSSGGGGVVCGGIGNWVNARLSTIAGGSENYTGGAGSFVAGGYRNRAVGNYSFAGGQNAEANHYGAFVWAGGAGAPFPSIEQNTVSFYALRGFSIDWNDQTANGRSNNWVFFGPAGNDSIQTWTGGRLTNGGTWANSSDVSRKTDFAKIDSATILAKVAALPIRQWRYKVESEEITHLGPTAQDFRAAFSLGDDDKSIATVDADGVALAAIQGLHRKLEETRAENARLQQENTEFRQRLARIEAQLGIAGEAN